VIVMVSLKSSRRFALTSAGLLVVVAVVVMASVIPSVKVDAYYTAATPERAVRAFWANVGLNILAATVLGLLAIRGRGRSRLTTTVLVVTAFVVVLLAIVLTDAASAFGSHGPAMRTATNLLFLCSAIDALAAVLIIATAIRFPKNA
jgi:hypothetical protein